ncbi:NADH:ubiquinone reductase (Na(+)-transporting) subunit B [Moritella viscosa]|uniref:Na(+)-translocating NADH-quinone reductase subunit B n=1 Tax=Moritella viscosa TaxID=80854 RepID=A0A090K4D6_9GAMM|nr:NADH:ubiquinone reductase (Na(+)-transporting) subunit B [Moritella viscosa]CED58633.1 Na(+)-translocating NADH-quinone reductase subunit B [Moritella viscosa]SGY82846.1 Na(+)-translocating NADH-quinone reductase subunit B-NQR complex subunit B-NQR-1 subunit B [Moritella viscosa]SGY83167.1 Na(+)-translocating NADH-quinone reductase subunit B-NQR complex subunit B-NQR-1 subunit B [Moritella viscosa]SGY83240.1 Na(+)-translocating NADH-quinone reductase subunit B-NQR complex subunit B-NQR-1 sub
MGLKNYIEEIEHHFEPGGKHEKWFALYEAIATGLFTPGFVTKGKTHVRDNIDLKRIMIMVWMCTFPMIFWGMYNIGAQANTAIATGAGIAFDDWHVALLSALGVTMGEGAGIFANMVYGAVYFLPIYATVFIVGGFWEVLFAAVRKHEVNEGFFVTSILFALILPANIPLWQAAIGITFGVVIAKEVFGGTGKNFLNPALAGRAFLFFAYPSDISGDAVWTAVDGFSGATALSSAAAGGLDGLTSSLTWADAFIGNMQGSTGEVSTLLILLGGGVLLFARIASWRIVAGVMIGMVATSLLFNMIGSDTNPMFEVPFYWHLVLGGFAFGMMFMATDPVSASFTDNGKWAYGILIGLMVVLIRVVNPAFPEGMMLAILFANLFAPLFDHFVVQANIKRRLARNG